MSVVEKANIKGSETTWHDSCRRYHNNPRLVYGTGEYLPGRIQNVKLRHSQAVYKGLVW